MSVPRETARAIVFSAIQAQLEQLGRGPIDANYEAGLILQLLERPSLSDAIAGLLEPMLPLAAETDPQRVCPGAARCPRAA